MKALKPIAAVLVILGAINWGLMGLGALMSAGGDWNIVHALLAGAPQLESIVYVLVGAAGVWFLLDWKKMMHV